MKEDRTCKYCKKIFENIDVKVFANHVRWCDKNTDYDKEHFRKKQREARYVKKIIVEKECQECGNIFLVERSFLKDGKIKQLKKERKCCSQRCAKRRHLSNEVKERMSKNIKRLWKNGFYDNTSFNNHLKNKKFTSKAEMEIRDYFIRNFPEDKWTFGGAIKKKNIHITRDLYSHKLKICVEYDGIWHFKDIHGQLKNKKMKDSLLEEWCVENGYKLVRIDEEVYKKEGMSLLIEAIYNNNNQIIKLGNRYLDISH